jgi:hypothetical protein
MVADGIVLPMRAGRSCMMPKTSQCGASDKAGLVKEGAKCCPHPGPLNSSDDSAGLPGKCGAARGKLRIDRSCSPFLGTAWAGSCAGSPTATRASAVAGGIRASSARDQKRCPCHQFTL